MTAPPGRQVTMTVGGTATAIAPGGGYSGAIVLTLGCGQSPLSRALTSSASG